MFCGFGLWDVDYMMWVWIMMIVGVNKCPRVLFSLLWDVDYMLWVWIMMIVGVNKCPYFVWFIMGC